MIYLCGITNSNEYDNIKALTDPIWEHVDGLIFGYDAPDGYSTGDPINDDHALNDECWRLLDERKGKGEIIHRPWTNDHDLQMNTFLRQGPLKHGDWFIIRDSMERFDPDFAKNLKDLISKWDAQGIRSIYNYGKGFAFKWNDSMVFQGSPHWGLQGAQMNAIDLKETYDEDKHEHTWRIKDGEEGGRPLDNKINHEAKYAWSYGRSNHLLLGYEDRLEEYKRAEMIRLHVRDLAALNDFPLTLEGLEDFMNWMASFNFDQLRRWVNSHRVWKNFYRSKILNHPFATIEKTEEQWELTNE